MTEQPKKFPPDDQPIYCHKCRRALKFNQFWEQKFFDNAGKHSKTVLEVELLCVGCGYKPHLFKVVERAK